MEERLGFAWTYRFSNSETTYFDDSARYMASFLSVRREEGKLLSPSVCSFRGLDI